MPSQLPQEALLEAEAAVVFAQLVRRTHRRRTNKESAQRQEDLQRAHARVLQAMKPLKSEIGRFPYGPQTDAAERNRETIRKASKALQSERRKIWKMLPHDEKD